MTNDKTANRSSFDIRQSSLSAPASVLLLSAEDDLADTIRPRLEALDADCEKILAVNTWCSLSETANPTSRRDSATCVARPFALHRDLPRLKNLLDAIPDCRLLIIDPVSAFLGGTSENANADVQSLLTALAALRDRELAAVVVSHLRKKEGTAIYRTMGSLAFVASARAAWLICKDPADANKRFFLPIKNNLSPDVAGLTYTIESSGECRTPVIRWSPEPVEVTADILLPTAVRSRGRPDHDRQYAMKWLKETLAEKPLSVWKVRQNADAFGIHHATLRRAFRDLDGEAVRLGWPTKSWYWRLPETPAQKYEGELCDTS